jgi:aryl-alcohol dehydrogenase-like predicted oxidoreductase
MEYRRLGKAGVKVSRLCLGTGVRGTVDENRLTRAIHAAIDYGCNFIDCANNYGQGQSEGILGRAIKGKRDDLVITTKVWTPVGAGPNDRGLSRYHILREAERSLKRLGTDRIDVYYMHRPDPETGIEETLRAMEDLVRQGKVRYVGASNHNAAQIIELLWCADRLGLEPIVCLQNHYNLLHRWTVEPELRAICVRYGLGLTTYSPLAIGLLAGHVRRGDAPPTGTPWTRDWLDRTLSERADHAIGALIELAAARSATPAQVAVAWLLDHPEVTAPIVGADRPEYVDDVFAALEIQLTPEERQTLDTTSQWNTPDAYL